MTTPIGGNSGTTSNSSGTSSTQNTLSGQLGEQAFLQLLVAELKNQDPNQPMDGQAMITQLAQLNQTQAAMQAATYQQEGFAANLIGQTVTGSINGKPVTGTPTGMSIDGSTVNLVVNGQAMNVTSVTQVGNAAINSTATTTPTPTSTNGGQA